MQSNNQRHVSTLVACDVLEPRRLMASDTFVSNGDGSLTVNGTSGNDHISIVHGGDFISITMNDEHTTAGAFALTPVFIYGLGGNDTIDAPLARYVNGGAGNDVIIGGVKNAVLTGGPGNDRITGGSLGNRLNGGTGNDTLNGGSARDRLYGDDGNDRLNGNSGVDYLYGGAGNDNLDGGNSTDYLFGDGGQDTLSGGNGNDSLDGGGGDDNLSADAGDDTLFGGAGNDTLTGGSGHDTIFGNSGDDRIQLKDLELDLADGGSGIDSATLDDFEKTFVVAESRSV